MIVFRNNEILTTIMSLIRFLSCNYFLLVNVALQIDFLWYKKLKYSQRHAIYRKEHDLCTYYLAINNRPLCFLQLQIVTYFSIENNNKKV